MVLADALHANFALGVHRESPRRRYSGSSYARSKSGVRPIPRQPPQSMTPAALRRSCRVEQPLFLETLFDAYADPAIKYLEYVAADSLRDATGQSIKDRKI